MKKVSFIFSVILCCVCSVSVLFAQQNVRGGIDEAMLRELRSSANLDAPERALQNIVIANGMSFNNAVRSQQPDDVFTYRVPQTGITDQKQSGRCWLFTGLNILRAEAVAKHNLATPFFFSQCYSFFYDQLEKSNLFLQAVIDTRSLPMSDQTVDWLFKHPIQDGGQFTGVSDNLMKYGVVPAEVMPETVASNRTAQLSSLLATILRQGGIRIREVAGKGASEQKLNTEKKELLKAVYKLLVINLGEPPLSFQYTLKSADGKVISSKNYTPQSFYNELIGRDLRKEYVMIMNDPSKEFHKLYQIRYDRHLYDGADWTYLNLPMDELKAMAIASLKDSCMIYYSCDVGKQLDRKTGILSLDNFDYSSLAGINLNMDKRERILTGASASTHAMTLVAVNLNEQGKPTKWMVENSWGADAGYKGHLIMTDEWFDEYTFRIVLEKRFLTPEARALTGMKPILLPPWDPMFAAEE